MATAPAFRQRLVEAINEGGSRAVVDMADVTFIDSTNLGVLASIRKVFEITGITSVLTP